MPRLKHYTSASLEKEFQIALINDFKNNNSDFIISESPFRKNKDNAKNKDAEIKFSHNGHDYYLTLEFKKDGEIKPFATVAQTIAYEYIATDEGLSPEMENFSGIIVSQSQIIFLDYHKMPNIITNLYEGFSNIQYGLHDKNSPSKLGDNKKIMKILIDNEEELRNAKKTFNLEDYENYYEIFKIIIDYLKDKINSLN